MSRRTGSDRGLTLIELLAAMAILAVVSLMAVQTLSGALFQRDILARADAQGADLIRALALLRRDLEAAVPVPLSAEDDRPAPAFRSTPDSFSVMRAGLGAAPGSIGRVDWALSGTGQLTRRVTFSEPSGPAVPVLESVRDMRLTALGQVAPSDDPEAARIPMLPAGFELTFQHARHGALRIVVAR